MDSASFQAGRDGIRSEGLQLTAAWDPKIPGMRAETMEGSGPEGRPSDMRNSIQKTHPRVNGRIRRKTAFWGCGTPRMEAKWKGEPANSGRLWNLHSLEGVGLCTLTVAPGNRCPQGPGGGKYESYLPAGWRTPEEPPETGGSWILNRIHTETGFFRIDISRK